MQVLSPVTSQIQLRGPEKTTEEDSHLTSELHSSYYMAVSCRKVKQVVGKQKITCQQYKKRREQRLGKETLGLGLTVFMSHNLSAPFGGLLGNMAAFLSHICSLQVTLYSYSC